MLIVKILKNIVKIKTYELNFQFSIRCILLILEKMKKLEIIFLAVLVLIILWGIQWMFHEFPTGS